MSSNFTDRNNPGIEVRLSFLDRLRVLFGSYIRLEIIPPTKIYREGVNVGEIKVRIISMPARTWRIFRALTRSTLYSADWIMPGNSTYAVYLEKRQSSPYPNFNMTYNFVRTMKIDPVKEAFVKALENSDKPARKE